MRLAAYRETDFVFSYFATHDIEIDLVIERPGRGPALIEIKSSERVRDADLRPLAALANDIGSSEALCLCREPRKRKVGPVLVCPWQDALKMLELA